jgi:hypothetical protein
MLAAGMPATTSDATLFHTASATWMIGAYQASAVAKLTSSTWRHDPVMWQIAKTVAYGRPGSTVIATLARSGRSLQYALVVLEFGSIALIVPLPLPFVFTLGAILLAFHVATWATLSLPQFVLPAAASLWSVACLHALL